MAWNAAHAAEQLQVTLPNCWTPAQLAGKPGEKASVRRHVILDKSALRKFDRLPSQPLDASLYGSIRSVKLPEGKKLIALTFDLCETPYSIAGYDGGIVDYLRTQNVRATFFASGKWLETHDERAQQLMADSLFIIGNHGMEHRDARHIRGVKMQEEIVLAQASYERTHAKLEARACRAPHASREAMLDIPRHMSLFRFPYGTCDTQALKAVADAGLLAIQWDVVSGDPDKGRSARAIAETVVSRTKPGSIIVAHANGRGWNTAAALPLIIPKLRTEGYEFVTVPELLAAGEPVIARNCYELRPGDNRNFHNTWKKPNRKKGKGKNVWSALLQSGE